MPLASLKGEALDYWTYLRITMPKEVTNAFHQDALLKLDV